MKDSKFLVTDVTSLLFSSPFPQEMLKNVFHKTKNVTASCTVGCCCVWPVGLVMSKKKSKLGTNYSLFGSLIGGGLILFFLWSLHSTYTEQGE
jgi:hypothetical protein